MSDLISREELLKQIETDSKGHEGQYGDEWLFIDTINSIPTAEPKVGRWIEQPPYKPFTDDDMEIFVAPKCSVCGKHGSHSNFCPNCGARMERSE